MPILEAVFRLDDIEESISIDTIESRPRFDVVRNNLYCVYDNCEAKLEYVPRGKHRAHFKTWPKQDHSEDCIDYFDREKRSRGERFSATATIALSDQHIANILNDIKRRRNKKETDESTSNTPKRKKKNPRVDPALPKENAINIIPTTGSGADMQEDEIKQKAPSVRRRNLLLLNEEDIGFTRCLFDVIIDSVEISNERVVISVVNDNKTSSCNVYFEEFFFTSAPVNFMRRFEALRKIVETNKGLYFSSVGEVIERNGSIHLLVNKHSDFRVEDLYISIFIDRYLHG